MIFDIIVVREGMLAEHYGARLWYKYIGCKVLATPPIIEMENYLLDQIRDKKVLIVGGYYRFNMDTILKVAKEVTVFYNNSDLNNFVPEHNFIKSNEFTGFLTWTIDYLSVEDEYVLRISKYLDEYLYGYPSEKALCFQKGVYINGNSDIEKLLTIKSIDDIESTIVKGTPSIISDRRIAKQRYKSAKYFTFKLSERTYSALVSIGDSPIVQSCLLLAEKSYTGVGILFRYDLNTCKTFIYARSTKESDVDVGSLMFDLVRGGGTKAMGAGSISKLIFPEQLLV